MCISLDCFVGLKEKVFHTKTSNPTPVFFFFLFCVKSIMAVFGILRKYMEDGMNEGVECCETLSSRHSMAVVLMSPQQLWLLMEDLHKTSS